VLTHSLCALSTFTFDPAAFFIGEPHVGAHVLQAQDQRTEFTSRTNERGLHYLHLKFDALDARLQQRIRESTTESDRRRTVRSGVAPALATTPTATPSPIPTPAVVASISEVKVDVTALTAKKNTSSSGKQLCDEWRSKCARR
jgi:hypothetical protein